MVKGEYMRFYAVFLTLGCVLIAPFLVAQEPEKGQVRPPILAGQWYSADKDELQQEVQSYLKKSPPANYYKELIALIVPHAGYKYSGLAAAYGYVTIDEQEIKRVVILAPPHRYPLRGCSILKVSHYQTPLGLVEVDTAVCRQLLGKKLFSTVSEAHREEHSIEIQLPFLQESIRGNFKIVPILVGDINGEDYQIIADALKPVVDATTLVVVSSDFTHYGSRFGYQLFAKEKKEELAENLGRLNFGAAESITNKDFNAFIEYQKKTGITICGYRPIAVLLKLLPPDSLGQLRCYYTSTDITGGKDYSDSVSYATICFTRGRELLNEDEKGTLLRLARQTLDTYLQSNSFPRVSLHDYNITPKFMEKTGVFVSIYKNGELRGCIGYIKGMVPLYQGVIENTINAATRDPRFQPMAHEEAKEVNLEISVMTPLQKIQNIEDIQVGTHGLYLVKGSSSGVLLPQVAARYGWDRLTFLKQVSLKAGLSADAWQQGAEIYVFKAQVFEEHLQPKSPQKNEPPR